jgi:hypothetical protein
MVLWMLNRLFRRGLQSQRGVSSLGGELEGLARSGVAAWLLAQERARLEFLAAKEAYCTHSTWRTLGRVLTRLLALNATNAVVQALLNEHLAERLLVEAGRDCRKPAPSNLRNSA